MRCYMAALTPLRSQYFPHNNIQSEWHVQSIVSITTCHCGCTRVHIHTESADCYIAHSTVGPIV